MNQPINEQLEELRKRVEKLEQQTEPIKVTRIEIDQGNELRQQIRQIEREQKDTNLTLNNHTEMLKEISEQSDRHTQAFAKVSEILNVHTETISGLQADVRAIKATQSDHGEILKEHSQRLGRLQTDVTGLKTDVTGIKTDVAGIKTTLAEILNRLPPKQ